MDDRKEHASDAVEAVYAAWYGYTLVRAAPRRFLALVIDFALLAPAAIFVDRLITLPTVLLGTLPLMVLYRIPCHWVFGATMGKRLTGLEIGPATGEPQPFEGPMYLLLYMVRWPLAWLGKPRARCLAETSAWRRSFRRCVTRESPLIAIVVWPVLLEWIPMGGAFAILLVIGLVFSVGWLAADASAVADSNGTSSLHDLIAGTGIRPRRRHKPPASG